MGSFLFFNCNLEGLTGFSLEDYSWLVSSEEGG